MASQLKKILIFGLIGSLLVWGSYQFIFLEIEDITAVQDEPYPPRVTQDIDVLVKQAINHYNHLKEQHQTLEINHEIVKMDDPKIKNWIIHTHIQSAVFKNEDLEGIKLVDQAVQYKNTNEVMAEWAIACGWDNIFVISCKS